MKTPHKHAEILMAIAEGKDVQFKDHEGKWTDYIEESHFSPLEHNGFFREWRIKPVPKPDVVLHMGFEFNKMINETDLLSVYAEADHDLDIVNHYPNILKLTFDGETGKLKSAKVINEQIN